MQDMPCSGVDLAGVAGLFANRKIGRTLAVLTGNKNVDFGHGFSPTHPRWVKTKKPASVEAGLDMDPCK
jgi:hypothetical protein